MAKADVDHRAQQDARRAALQRVPRTVPAQFGELFRQLLRLLSAGGVHPVERHVYRQGGADQRRDRQAAPRGDDGAAHAARRDHRGVGVVHLRPRRAGGVRAEYFPLQSRRPRAGVASN